MGITKYFVDNVTYGADDVNSVLSRLTTGGVALFNNTGSFNADLNTAIANAATTGVDSYNANSCKVVKTGDVFSISEGVCFLNNGAQLVIDQSGYILDITENQINYVYAEYDTVAKDISIVVSDTAGGTGTVSLATINADGTITDTRLIAKAKIALATANFTTERENITVSALNNTVTTTDVEIGSAGFNLVHISCGTHYQNWIDVNNSDIHDAFYAGGDIIITVQKSGSILKIYSVMAGDQTPRSCQINIKVY